MNSLESHIDNKKVRIMISLFSNEREKPKLLNEMIDFEDVDFDDIMSDESIDHYQRVFLIRNKIQSYEDLDNIESISKIIFLDVPFMGTYINMITDDIRQRVTVSSLIISSIFLLDVLINSCYCYI